ncbi:50S ribosomal protein L3 N(5)-glutamine methyltransferase [Halorhodospira halochloris]|nr:50S ribosomal protein L3 N(5)-glutamine methyltransferase [Halorhodospira halochloris]MBK1652778.1 50S ribosomal protein L3 N(5)-glutamine methyltransferase [Halorhodospira halochloris]MCG5530791.1 50S ribosomal protein L3 N(5)-glutamine methyltransferase [Halorhodospira halochloris]MCG5549226.1 50S ribosomal protein L3 N(5)-glutamine methyltransferase [Halorhodospira halochloris]
METLRDMVRYAASRFNEAGIYFGHGTDNAIDEAAALALFALNLPPDTPEIYWGARLTGAERQAVMDLVRRRIEQRVPLPYITNQIHFAGLPFYVDERVLVPRSPLAELIEQSLQPWVDPHSVSRILEIGTGSGCIAIACAYAFPQARVDATDTSYAALEVAAINIQRHGLGDRVRLFNSDVFADVPDESYQIIITNPPYVDQTAMDALPPEYKHEPLNALAGGDDGLDVVRRIVDGASRYLSEDGILVVEVGDSDDAVAKTFPNLPAMWVELERGGHGVFILAATELKNWHAA